MTWQSLTTLPKKDWKDSTRNYVLVYSSQIGKQLADLSQYPDGIVRGSISGYHGDPVADWGVILWMPLPDDPTLAEVAAAQKEYHQ